MCDLQAQVLRSAQKGMKSFSLQNQRRRSIDIRLNSIGGLQHDSQRLVELDIEQPPKADGKRRGGRLAKLNRVRVSMANEVVPLTAVTPLESFGLDSRQKTPSHDRKKSKTT